MLSSITLLNSFISRSFIISNLNTLSIYKLSKDVSLDKSGNLFTFSLKNKRLVHHALIHSGVQ